MKRVDDIEESQPTYDYSRLETVVVRDMLSATDCMSQEELEMYLKTHPENPANCAGGTFGSFLIL